MSGTQTKQKNGGKEEEVITLNYANEIGPLRRAAMAQGYAGLTGEFVCNYLLSRAGLASKLGHEDSKRDIDRECNYPENPDADFYVRLYRRGDIAVRVNDMWPDMTWEESPQILEQEANTSAEATPFEAAFARVALEHALFSKFLMVDRVSGLGQYGCLFFGLPGPTDQPALGWDAKVRNWSTSLPSPQPLAYVKTLGETHCKIMSYETDPSHKRYGLPVLYQVTLANLGETNRNSASPPMGTLMVHCSRMVHVCEGFLGSETHGAPRLESVLNRLLDIRKIAGGSGEMFWKGGFPGIAFEVDPKNTEVELDRDALRAEMNAFSDGLQRYLALVGVKATSLKVQVADPTAHTDMNLKLIAIAKNIPYRVFAGTEEGKLAGTQDQKATEKRVGKRREQWASPVVVRPTVELLVRTGVIPPPGQKTGGRIGKENPSPGLAEVGAGQMGQEGTRYKPAGLYTEAGPAEGMQTGVTGTGAEVVPTAYVLPEAMGVLAGVRSGADMGEGERGGETDKKRDAERGAETGRETGGSGPIGPKGAEVPTSSTRLEFSILWPPSGRPSEQEAADILLKVATALDYYTKGNASLIMHPMDFLVDIVGLTQERATQILDRVNGATEGEDALLAGQLAILESAAKSVAASSSSSPPSAMPSEPEEEDSDTSEADSKSDDEPPATAATAKNRRKKE